MASLNVSAAHSLRLLPIGRLRQFAHYRTCVNLAWLVPPDDAEEIPGSIRITSSGENGIIKKNITYKRKITGHAAADQLEGYKATRLIALYVDETGQMRVAGSPDYPLAFSFTSGDGVFTCTIEGEAPTIDGFLL